MVCSTVCFGVMCNFLIDDYLEGETVTDTGVVFKNRMQFPAVTICNTNWGSTDGLLSDAAKRYWPTKQRPVAQSDQMNDAALNFRLSSVWTSDERKAVSVPTFACVLRVFPLLCLRPSTDRTPSPTQLLLLPAHVTLSSLHPLSVPTPHLTLPSANPPPHIA
jgi:hypothetical protein